MKYYWKKLIKRISEIFAWKRLRLYGVRIAILDFIIFLCRRSETSFSHKLIQKKDRFVQKYLYDNYYDIFEKYKEI